MMSGWCVLWVAVLVCGWGAAGHGTRSGDDANAEVFLELLEEDEGEHCVRNQADPRWDEALQQEFWNKLIFALTFVNLKLLYVLCTSVQLKKKMCVHAYT